MEVFLLLGYVKMFSVVACKLITDMLAQTIEMKSHIIPYIQYDGADVNDRRKRFKIPLFFWKTADNIFCCFWKNSGNRSHMHHRTNKTLHIM